MEQLDAAILNLISQVKRDVDANESPEYIRGLHVALGACVIQRYWPNHPALPIDHLARAEAEITHEGFPDPSARSLDAAITHLIAYLKEQR